MDEQHEKGIAMPGGAKICVACFRELFELAIKDEAEYPAHWGPTRLDYELYYSHLGEDLYTRYEAKASEYKIPVRERVYCKRTDPPRRPDPCGHFVGPWNAKKECVRCKKCMWYTCLRCEETFSPGDSSGEETDIAHDCDPTKNSELNSRALTNQQRGIDFQICPNSECQRVWAIWDGCNHMRCSCRTYFCYICGIKIGREYSHFANTDCPQYGFRRRRGWTADQLRMDAIFGDIEGDGYAAHIQWLSDNGRLVPGMPRETLLQEIERDEFMLWRQHAHEAHRFVCAELAEGRNPRMFGQWPDPERYADRVERFIVRMGTFAWRIAPEGAPADWQNPLRREHGYPPTPPRPTTGVWASMQINRYPHPEDAWHPEGHLNATTVEYRLEFILPIRGPPNIRQLAAMIPREVANEHRGRQRLGPQQEIPNEHRGQEGPAQAANGARGYWLPGGRLAAAANVEEPQVWRDLWARLRGRRHGAARAVADRLHVEEIAGIQAAAERLDMEEIMEIQAAAQYRHINDIPRIHAALARGQQPLLPLIDRVERAERRRTD